MIQTASEKPLQMLNSSLYGKPLVIKKTVVYVTQHGAEIKHAQLADICTFDSTYLLRFRSSVSSSITPRAC
jgi:hypothetical protein